MSLFDNYVPPSEADLLAVVNRVLSAPSNRRVPWVEDDGFERADADMGRSADDDEMADRAADREAAWLGGER